MKFLTRFNAFIGAAALGLLVLVSAAGHDVETNENAVILAGYDAVAYFTEGKPTKGKAKYTATYNDAIYRFNSAENRDAFRANPANYAPQYGGFCAYGLTFGKKFEVDGKAFEIVDGKLYVNKNASVKKAWSKDIPKHIGEADGHWPKVAATPASQL